VSRPGDALEREADAVADQVLSGGTATSLSSTAHQGVWRTPRAVAASGTGDSRSPAAPKALQGDPGSSIPGSGQALSASTRMYFEARLGGDLSGVRVHTDSAAGHAAEALNALAYTAGSHIVFAHGAYRPDTRSGQRLLAHELVHTLQQPRLTQPGLIQRTCRSHPDESFYASSPNYCRDTGFTGMFHSSQTCYREVPHRSSYFECPPGDQVCFEADGTCHDSYDEASPVESRDSDGRPERAAAGA
jgi:hypothetical protein